MDVLSLSSRGGIGHAHYVRFVVVIFVETAWMSCHCCCCLTGIGHACHVVAIMAWSCVSHPALCKSHPTRHGRFVVLACDALPL